MDKRSNYDSVYFDRSLGSVKLVYTRRKRKKVGNMCYIDDSALF
jgi:hypothetical protein